MKGYDFNKTDLSEYLYPNNTAYTPTDDEMVYFESVMDSFLKLYKNIRPKEYLFEYVFSKNKYGEVEVWMQGFFYQFCIPIEEIEGPCSISDPGSFVYYSVVNVSRDKAYFHRVKDPRGPLFDEKVSGYFYMGGKTKEVKNSNEYIYNPEIWRDFDFDDWLPVE